MTRVRTFGALLVALACSLVVAPAAHGAFDVTDFSVSLTDPGTSAAPATTDLLTGGAHPDLFVRLGFPSKQDDGGNSVPDESVKNVNVRLPRGLTANPSVAPTCTQAQLGAGFYPNCPIDSQVGVVKIILASIPNFPIAAPLYNMDRPDGAPAQFAFNFNKVVVKLNAQVRTGEGYGLAADVSNISQGLPLIGTDVTLWGVPSDPVHDTDRFAPGGTPGPNSSSLPRRPFVTNPTSCEGPTTFGVSAFSWQNPSRVIDRSDATQPGGAPFTFTDCAALPFEPTVSVTPTTTAPDSPTGLEVSVGVPQKASPDVRAASHLRDLKLTLPPGMAVNPSAAAGLGSCSSAQVALSSSSAAACPESAKIGTVAITTPLLGEPLDGGVYLAAQGDNPFGTLLGIYLVVNDQGVVLKLPGRIDADPATGQLVATFADNPQLPFSRLDVTLNGGSRAVLTTPASCGSKVATADVTPWSGGASRSIASGFSVDCAAGLGGFAPTFSAGTRSPSAAVSSPLIVNVDRPDGQSPLNRLSLRLPQGLLASLRGVRRCTDAQANAGTCDALARVGGATVRAGAGPEPFSLPGDVFLTGPYKGAPFGLAVRVRAVAGPLDLGTVVVRQALFIDPTDTHVTVVSDPLPTILQGIPIRLRTLDVNVDRPGFAINPTSCADGRVRGNLGSVAGQTSSLTVRFQVGGCDALGFSPKLALRLLGSGGALRDGGHPSLKAILTQPVRQANLRAAEVKLPLSLALDPDNAQTLCEFAEGAKAVPSCPAGSVVGQASARTPLLGTTLRGPVYFVKGQRTDRRTGRVIKTLPTLVVPLSGDGVRITLRARTSVSGGRLVTKFAPIPDAPVSRFDLRIDGGSNGILVANSSVCSKSRELGIGIRGHNGALVRSSPSLAATCR